MEIILTQNVARLGLKDDLVEVKDGYARNYLIPKGYAIKATESAKKVQAENIKQRAHKQEKLKADAQQIADKLQGTELKIGAKTSTTGKIFGSVNTIQLAEALGKKGFDIDRKLIILPDDTVKEIGQYTAKVVLYRDVEVEIPFEVFSE